MKNRIPVCAFLVLAACLTGCSALPADETPPAAVPTSSPEPEVPQPTATAAQGWRVVGRTEDVGVYSAMVAGFVDERHGIVAGVNGEVHYSQDGGVTWPRADNVSACRFGLDIVDADTAWTVGNKGEVRFSQDGGKTWRNAADIPWRAHMVAFADDANGWAAGISNLAGTGDGALTWTELALPEGVRKIAAVDLRDGGRGYLLDNGGTLHVTSDGGLTWTAIPLDLEKKIIAGESLPLTAVRFPDPEHGVIIASLEQSGGTLIALRTADGGSSWTEEDIPEKLGALFLTHDGALLTVLEGSGRIALLTLG